MLPTRPLTAKKKRIRTKEYSFSLISIKNDSLFASLACNFCQQKEKKDVKRESEKKHLSIDLVLFMIIFFPLLFFLDIFLTTLKISSRKIKFFSGISKIHNNATLTPPCEQNRNS